MTDAENPRPAESDPAPPHQESEVPAGAYVVAASLPQRAEVAALVEVEATGFRVAGPARIHTYRAGSLMLTDHGELSDPPRQALAALHGGEAGQDAVRWVEGLGQGAFLSPSPLPDTIEGFLVADNHLWSVALTGQVGSADPYVIVERLLRAIVGAPQT